MNEILKNAAANIPSLQWFPGHMKKAERLIVENLKSVDIVIELLDARIPLSSQNPLLNELLGEKPRIKVLAKSDLADERQTKKFIEKFRACGITAIATDAGTGAGLKNLIAAAKKAAEPKTQKFHRGARAMTVGIPNVGKSSLINRLAGGNRTKTENRPGITRANRLIKIADGLDLFDTPGVLWAKFDDPEVAIKLAWTYAINDDVYDIEPAVYILLEVLAEKYPAPLCDRFKLSAEILEKPGHEILEKIAVNRGCIRKGGTIDVDKAAKLILTEFRSGKLGRVTLDDPV